MSRHGMDIMPSQTLYIRNLNDKVQKEGACIVIVGGLDVPSDLTTHRRDEEDVVRTVHCVR